MAYCTLQEVQGRMRGPALSSSSTPTSSEAEAIIADISSVIDAALEANDVTAPASTTSAFTKFLRAVCVAGSVAAIEATRRATGSNPSRTETVAQKFFDDWMKRLWDGKAIPSALSGSGNGLAESYSQYYPDEDSDLGAIQEPVFGQALKW